MTTAVTYGLTTGQLDQLAHTVGVAPLADFGYGYNGLGNVTQIAELSDTWPGP